MFILPRIDIEIFKSLVKILGAGPRPKQRHRNWYRFPFIETLHISVFLDAEQR